MVCGGVLQSTFNRLQKTIGNIALGGLGAYEETLGMAHVCQLELGVGQAHHSRENTEALDKANGSVARHRTGYDEGMESRTVMVPANGMVYKLREELKNDGTLLFGLIFLAYLDIGGEYFCLLHHLFIFMCTS